MLQPNNSPTILILDLDGVLITTPPWKQDMIATDGYSEFNKICVQQLNRLLKAHLFEIWLSSSRRKSQSLSFFKQLFSNRGVHTPLTGMLPISQDHQSRKQEIEFFLEQKSPVHFLIIDDDKSLNALAPQLKSQLILTSYLKGFDEEKRIEALKKLSLSL